MTINIANRTKTSFPPLTDPYPEVPRSVIALAREYPAGFEIPPAMHSRGQLVYASEGVMTVNTPIGTWVVPPQRAVWVPARTPHWTRTVSLISMRNLYVESTTTGLPDECCVMNITPLLRELIVEVARLPPLYGTEGPEGRLVAVLLDRLQTVTQAPLHLPLPSDDRLVPITNALRADPAETRSLEDWSRDVGASSRTLSRLFLKETGIGFRSWRQQARLLHALECLALNMTVSEVAITCGYETPSAFVAMFRRALGASPGRYFGKNSASRKSVV